MCLPPLSNFALSVFSGFNAQILWLPFIWPGLFHEGGTAHRDAWEAPSIGALLAVSFCERINYVANQVVTKGNSVLGTDEIIKIVILRMNRAS